MTACNRTCPAALIASASLIWIWVGIGASGCTTAPAEPPTDASSSSTSSASTSSASTSSASTSGPGTTGTTAHADSTSTGTTAVGSETVGFVFDVGGGMATGFIPDLPVPLDYDCDNLTQPYVSETELGAPRGYHDVAFDDAGHIIGWDGNSLLKVTYDDMVSVFLPGASGVQGLDMLENGDLLMVSNFGELRRVTPVPQTSVVASGLSGAYGVTVGPDGMAYVCGSNGVTRIDPTSGAQSPFVSIPGGSPRAIVFNLDSTGVYISSLFGPSSPVYFVPLDQDLDPSGPAEVFATNVGQGYHDGLGIDACGNLYVPDYNTSGLYRVDPDGVVTTIYNELTESFNHYGHGVEWGSGIDGWDDHAIYLPQPYDGNTVNEIVLGVPSASTVRTWR